MTVYTMGAVRPSGPRPPLKGDYGAVRVGENLDAEAIMLRDKIAIGVMHQMLDQNHLLFRDQHYLSAQSYRVADAMLAARRG